MWTRKQLKEKGRNSFLANYWKSVLVALILVIIAGGAGAVSGGSGLRFNFRPHVSLPAAEQQRPDLITDPEAGAILHEITDDIRNDIADDIADDLPFDFDSSGDAWSSAGTAAGIAVLTMIIGIIGFIALIVSVIAILIRAFLLNPLQGGITRFFVRNLNDRGSIRELAYCYDHGYLNVVKTIFLKDLFTFLWSLLFIIPGIIKSYEYRMIPYILAEDPEMPCSEVFAKSKEMMRGNKWDAFVLDLSFLGWEILSLLTIGILGVFYVNPYRFMTNAALYEALEYGNGGNPENARDTQQDTGI